MPNKVFYIAPLLLSDAEGLHKFMMSNVKHFVIYLPYILAKNLKLENSKLFIKHQLEKAQAKHEFTFTLKRKDTNAIFGLIILKELDWKKQLGELAYCIDFKTQNKGIMTQAIKEISIYAFTKLNLKTLQIITDKSNIGSIRVAKKSGYTWKTTLKNQYATPTASTLDMELYELKNER